MISENVSISRWTIAWTFIALLLFALFLHRAWFIPETDYVAYYNAGQRALAGSNLYLPDPTPFKYLPVVSYFFVPLALLPFHFSKVAFFVLSFALGLAVYLRVHRQIGNWGTLMVLAAMLRFHNYDFLNSQVNHVLLFTLILYLNWRRTHPVRATFIFSLLASFKVLPLLIIGPLFFMKRYRESILLVAWFSALSLVPILTFQDGIHTYLNWFQLMRDTTEFPAPSGAILQSIQGALWYWIGPLLPHTNYFSAISYLIQFLLLGTCCLYATRSTGSSEDDQRIIMASMVVSVVISPLAWKHNFLLILPAFVILLESRQYRAVGTAFFLMTLWAGVVGIFSKHWVDRSYTTLLGALVLLFALLSVFKTRTRQLHSRWH